LDTKCEDIFQCFDNFFSEHLIPWENALGFAAMVQQHNWEKIMNNIPRPWQRTQGKMNALFSQQRRISQKEFIRGAA